MGIAYHTYIGKQVTHLPNLPCRAAGNVSLNTPVGNCVDKFGRIWLADTAHNRVLVFDRKMDKLLASFGSVGNSSQQFNMPFRLLPHPDKPWIYVSDIANKRIHILEYDHALSIRSISNFGSGDPINLQGPNGLAFFQGKLCVADEFYEGENGESRLVIFNEEGKWLRDITVIEAKEQVHFLWPQGLSCDLDGHLYIANTGFATVVRCDWEGNPVPFADGKTYLDGIDLARDVSIIDNRILIPGAKQYSVSVYDIDGHFSGNLTGFFSPIQITKLDQNRLLITEPILASLQIHQIDWSELSPQLPISTLVVDQLGDERDKKGQLHFVTSVAGDTSPVPTNNSESRYPIISEWWENHFEQQDKWLNSIHQIDAPSWVSMTLSTQMEWTQKWQQTWVRIFLGDKFDDPNQLLWLVDAGNYQLQATESSQPDAARPGSLPLLPGSLGICSLTPSSPLLGQLNPDIPLLVVSNYISGIVTIYQYDDLIGELVPFSYFGGLGHQEWQLFKPQGVAVDPISRDIYIADSGNNRISRWRLNQQGIAGLVTTFGEKGDGDNQFFTPTDITITPDGQKYITDQNNNRVVIYDRHDQYVGSFGQQGYGTNNDNFLLPTSIDFDHGKLFVSDLVNRAIKVFDQQGHFIDSFSGFGADPSKGQLWMPYLLHAHNHTLYLPDCALNRVNVYKIS
ncbi:NHL repeat-containing protein [Vibrio europaeus]|uniref:NHL repeat-containing protein n=1 Tax=Vibrio europaeus TaxID=300876 RepID=UPI0023407649|nr:NHL repeat-containing protein [Vibrio europaeus]MDC5848774.1 NHL repeat-containing protein [Vibrio europaeus]